MIKITKMATVTPAMRATGDDFPSVTRSWPGSRRATTGSLNGESDVVGRFTNVVGEAFPTTVVVGSVDDGVLDRSVTTDEEGIVEGTWEVDDEPWVTVEAACCLGDEREDLPKGFVVAMGCNVDVDIVQLKDPSYLNSKTKLSVFFSFLQFIVSLMIPPVMESKLVVLITSRSKELLSFRLSLNVVPARMTFGVPSHLK